MTARPSGRSNRPDIFISYAEVDKALADRVARTLDEKGLKYYLARKSIQGGTDFVQDIKRNISDCEEVFLLLTQHSAESEWVKVECGAAWALGKRVTPILEQEETRHLLPFVLRNFQYRLLENISRAADEYLERHIAEESDDDRYFVGIDVGKESINYCLVDALGAQPPIPPGVRRSPSSFSGVYDLLADLIAEIFAEAQRRGISRISGIGIGLPGIVSPGRGTLAHSPSFGIKSENFVSKLTERIAFDREPVAALLPGDEPSIPIAIDNDVRCATRAVWHKGNLQKDSLVCIFVGNGLGSGIVANGQMVYGAQFSAGEAGHTTISKDPDIFRAPLDRCHCGGNGHHWEMYVCSYGVLHLAKTLDPDRYAGLLRDYASDEGAELTTQQLAQAFRQGQEYAGEIVERFLEYLAIGVANYLHVLDPNLVVLGGGMIRGFVRDEPINPNSPQTTRSVFLTKINDYLTPPFSSDTLAFDMTPKEDLACVGAALIFKDESYFRQPGLSR